MGTTYACLKRTAKARCAGPLAALGLLYRLNSRLHVCSAHFFAFHHGQHSGRLLKIMLTGVDHLFGIWLSFFRENLATFVALFVMLPLSLFMNWRLGGLLIVLIVFFAVANAWVVGKTDRMQKEVEDYHSQLASRAGDALGNIHLIQSFVRLAMETSEMHRIIGRTLAAQFPVLNWWALLSVLTRAASTVTIILIFVLGTWLYTRGEATVGQIVFCHLTGAAKFAGRSHFGTAVF